MMKLYLAPGACSLSPHIVALEAGIPLELKKVDLKTKQINGGGSLTTISPKGSVPVLQLEDGQILTEGSAIVQFLAEQKPDAGLMPPAGSMDRYRVLEWLNFITSEIHKSFGPLFNPNAVGEWKAAATANLERQFGFLEKQLAGKSYLMGAAFSVADAYLFTVLNWTKFIGLDIAKHTALSAYVARVASRPKVQEAIKAEKAL